MLGEKATDLTFISFLSLSSLDSSDSQVRKAGSSVYHLACFACDLCQRQLSTGEQFTIDSVESKLLCKLHFGINKEGKPSLQLNQV